MSDQYPPTGPTEPYGSQPGQPYQPTPPGQGYPQQQPYAGQPGYQQPGYPQPGYPQPGYPQPGYAPAATPKTPGIAVWGLVLAFLAAPVGLVLSLVSLGRTKRAGAGRGLAVTGVIVGALFTLGGVGIGVAVFGLVNAVSAPKAAVIALNDAIDQNDCQAFFDVTTDSFREQLGVADCDTFAQVQANSVEGLTDRKVAVSSINIENSEATVETHEEYVASDGSSFSDGTYNLVKEGGDWHVNSASWS